MEAAVAATWEDWPDDRKRELRARLLELRRRPWREAARAEQLPPTGDWYIWFLVGGRGAGKTRSGAEWLAEELQADGQGDESAIVAPTFGDARDTCVEGPTGLLAALGTSRAEVEAGRSWTVERWNRSLGEIHLRSGAMVRIDGADDGALRIQGKNLKRAWCDELRLWKKAAEAWDESLLLAVRLGNPHIVVTSSPKPTALVKRLLRGKDGKPAEADVVSHMTMQENRANLSPKFLEQMERRYGGTRLGRQELLGQLLEDVEGALWRQMWIDEARATAPPHGGLRRTVVGMDPSDGTEDGAEQGIAVAGTALDHKLYVVKSEGYRDTALGYCKRAVRFAVAYKASIVVEKNHGGAYLVQVLDEAMKELRVHVPVRVVSASTGKKTRAEPVAALYEQRKVRHLGVFPELEEQQTTWTPEEKSPDRMDALVWAITELMGYGEEMAGAEANGGVAAWGGDEPAKERDAVAAWG
jgi:phage terminase large subunit-like protein